MAASVRPTNGTATDGFATTATSVAVTKPTATQEGDVIIVALAFSNLSPGAASASGFAAVPGTSNPQQSSSSSSALLYKVAGASEPASWNFSWSAQSSGTYQVVAIQGASGLDGSGQSGHGVGAGDGTGYVAPNLSGAPTTSNALLVNVFCGDNPGAGIKGSFGGISLNVQSKDNANFNANTGFGGIHTEALAVSGAPGTRSATAASTTGTALSIQYTSHSVAVKAAGTAPAWQSMSSASVTGASSVSVNKPAGTTLGDLLVAFVQANTGTETITGPADWTFVKGKNNANSLTLNCYYKVATATEPADPAYSWSRQTNGAMAVTVHRLTGQSTVAPIDPTECSATANDNSVTLSNNVVVSSVTTTVANSLLMFACAVAGNATTVTPPGTMSEPAGWDLNLANSRSQEGALETFATPGATGTRTATEDAALHQDSHALLITVRPPFSAPATPTPATFVSLVSIPNVTVSTGLKVTKTLTLQWNVAAVAGGGAPATWSPSILDGTGRVVCGTTTGTGFLVGGDTGGVHKDTANGLVGFNAGLGNRSVAPAVDSSLSLAARQVAAIAGNASQFVAVVGNGASGGIYRRTPSDSSWLMQTTGYWGNASSNRDGGAQVIPANEPRQAGRRLAMLGSTVWASVYRSSAVSKGMVRSSNGGVSWDPWRFDVVNKEYTAIVVSPQFQTAGSMVVYASARETGGLLNHEVLICRVADGASTFTRLDISGTGVPAGGLHGVLDMDVVVEATKDVLYVVNGCDDSTVSSRGVWRCVLSNDSSGNTPASSAWTATSSTVAWSQLGVGQLPGATGAPGSSPNNWWSSIRVRRVVV